MNTFVSNKARHRWYPWSWRGIYATLSAIAVLTGCGSDNTPEAPVFADDRAYVSITIANQGANFTRNPGEDSLDTNGEGGTLAENYINIDDLYVMTFSVPPADGHVVNDNSKLLEILWAPDAEERTVESYITSTGEHIWLKTRLDASLADYEGDFAVVAIANFSSFPHSDAYSEFKPKEGMTFGDLRQSGIFDFRQINADSPQDWTWMPDNSPETSCGIPVFGVKQVNLSGYSSRVFNSENPYPLVNNGNSTLWMLRALAKVAIKLDPELNGLVHNGAEVNVKMQSADIGNGYASRFQLIPDLSRMQGFSRTGGTGQIAELPDATTANSIMTRAATGNKLSFNINEAQDYAVIYLPEYSLTTPPEINLKLHIKDDKQDQDKEFKFGLAKIEVEGTDPDNGNWWKCLLRNHTYYYKVNLDYTIVAIVPSNWGTAFDNDFEFGELVLPDNPD